MMLVIMMASFAILTQNATAGDAAKGAKLFKKKFCKNCHAVDSSKKAKLAKKGPYLAKIGKERSKAWLSKFLDNPKAVAAKDSTLKKLEGSFKKKMSKPKINAEQKEDIIAYLLSLK